MYLYFNVVIWLFNVVFIYNYIYKSIYFILVLNVEWNICGGINFMILLKIDGIILKIISDYFNYVCKINV